MAQDPGLHWHSHYDFGNEHEIVIRHACDKYLRIDPARHEHHQIDGNGGTGQWARWEVKKKEHGHIQFRSKKTGKFLRIHEDGKVIDAGGMGGKFCNFIIHRQNRGVYKLESHHFNGKYVAVDKNGPRVGVGGPWCRLEFYKEGQPPPFHKKYMFAIKNIVIIEPRGHHGNLKVPNHGHELHTGGGHGEFAKWEVYPSDGGKSIKIKSTKNDHYIRIHGPHGGKIDCGGAGGQFTDFKVHIGDAVNHVRLESHKHPGRFVAVNDQGHLFVAHDSQDKHCLLTFFKD